MPADLESLRTADADAAARFFAEVGPEDLVSAVAATSDDDLLGLVGREEVRPAAVAGIVARLHEYAVDAALKSLHGVVRFDLATGEKTSFDLNTLNEPDEDRPLGWCRGVLPIGDGRQAWVGFSRLRYTTLRRNLSWIRHGFRETEHHRERPTRIDLYELGRGEPDLRRQIDLESVRLGAVFSIHGA